MSGSQRVQIPGSERSLHPDHVRVSDVDLSGNVEVTVYLRHRVAPDWIDEEARRHRTPAGASPREQWAQAHGAHPDHVNAVCSFAEEHGLGVGRTDEGRRQVRIMGSVGAVADAFGAKLEGMYAPSQDGPAYRARSGPLTVPEDLGEFVTGVFGLDDRPRGPPADPASRRPALSPTRRPRSRGPTASRAASTAGRRRSGSSSSAAATRSPT